jgi:hypothetical protein
VQHGIHAVNVPIRVRIRKVTFGPSPMRHRDSTPGLASAVQYFNFRVMGAVAHHMSLSGSTASGHRWRQMKPSISPRG